MINPNMNEQFVPAFPFGEPNESVTIAKEEALIKDSAGTVLLDGYAEVRLDLLPKPSIHVYFTNKNELDIARRIGITYELSSGKPMELGLIKNRKQIEVLSLAPDLSHPNASSLFSPSCEPIIGVGDDSTQMHYVIFHLFNFKKIRGTSRSFEERGIEHVNLTSDNWVVKLRSLADTENCFMKLKSVGGYGLTHIGKLEKADNTTFSGNEATSMLGALWYFLSFANGDWCVPVCAVGFDSSGNRIWESWLSPSGSSFSELSWFDAHHSEQIEKLFPGFMSHWVDENWNDTFQKAIYWYLTANNSKIDAGIILTQTALERLSFEYAVMKRKLISADSFMKLKASDKFKLIFSSLEISIDISKNLPELEKLAKEMKWEDATHAMSEI